MEKALTTAGVEAKLIRIPGGTHAADFGNPPNPPDFRGEMVAWFGRLLKANRTAIAKRKSRITGSLMDFDLRLRGRESRSI
jgi:hypothetical protein